MVEKFLLVGLKADLPAVRDANKLYWCSDTRELYKGQDLYTEAVRIVDALPDAMAQGVLYVLPSGEAKVFNGTDVVTVAKPYVDSTNGVLTADNTDDQVATAKMVYDSIAQAVGAVTEGGELVNNIFSTKAGTVTVTKGAYAQVATDATFSAGTNYFKKVDDQYVLTNVDETNFVTMVADGLFISSDEVDVAIKGVVVDPTYDPSTRTITLPYADGTESLVINLGKDIFVDPTAENKYNTETGNIEIFLNDGSMSYEQVSAMMSQTSVVSVGLTPSAVYDASYSGDYFDGTGAKITVADESRFNDQVSIGQLYVPFAQFDSFYPGVATFYTDLGGEKQAQDVANYGSLGDAAMNEYNQTMVDGPINMYIGTNSQTKIEIPASELVDIYTGATGADGSATVSVSANNVITAEVNVSAEADNVLNKKADGLYVDAPTKAQHAEAVADIDAIDTQLNGEEIVLKDAGTATGEDYTFNANDTVVVDGVETEVEDKAALDAIVADTNVQSVVVTTSNIEDRLADVEAGVAANAEAIEANAASIEELREFVGESEVHVDAEADNKYNKETGKIELFLNDGVDEYEKVEQGGATLILTPSAKYVPGWDSNYQVVTRSGYDYVTGAEVKSEEDFYNYLNHEEYTISVDMYPFDEAYPGVTSYYIANGDGTYTEKELTETDHNSGELSLVYSITNEWWQNSQFETYIKANKQAATKIEVDATDIKSDIATNKANIEELQSLVGELPEGVEATNVVDYINDLVGGTEVHVDAEADNKYNAETGNVELFLNDGGNTENLVIFVNNKYAPKVLNNKTYSELTSTGSYKVYDENGTQITSENMFNQAQSVYIRHNYGGLFDSIPDAIPSDELIYYIDDETGESVQIDVTSKTNLGLSDTESLSIYRTIQPTKVEVDMSELTDEINTRLEELDASDTFVDPTADNKYNAETDKVELFLNDSTTTKENIVLYYQTVYDTNGNTISNVALYKVLHVPATVPAPENQTVSGGYFDKDHKFVILTEENKEDLVKQGLYIRPFTGADSSIHVATFVTYIAGNVALTAENSNIYYIDDDTQEVTQYVERSSAILTDGSLNQSQTLFNSLSGTERSSMFMVSTEATKINVDMSGLSSKVTANADAIAKAKTDLEAYADQVEVDAKAYTDEKIADLVDSAPEALDTLKELATAINENKDIYDGYVELHKEEMDAMKAELEEAIANVETDLANTAEVHVDAEADNKYNAETGKVELFLNDGGEIKESVAKVDPSNENPTFKIKSTTATYEANPYEYFYCDEEFNDISSEITSANFAEKVAEGLWVQSKRNSSSANDVTVRFALESNDTPIEGLYYINSETGATVAATQHYSLYSEDFLATGYMISEVPATKVEVDMSELTEEINTRLEELDASDTFVDSTADNKYNAETGKVELFLNDGEAEFEPLTVVKEVSGRYNIYFKVRSIADLSSTIINSIGDTTASIYWYDSSLNDITSQVTAANIEDKIAQGLYYSQAMLLNRNSINDSSIHYGLNDIYPNVTGIYYQNSSGEYVTLESTGYNSWYGNGYTAYYYYAPAAEKVNLIGTLSLKNVTVEATKIEVDMSGLNNQVAANAAAVAAVTATVNDGLYVQVEADAAYVAGTTYYKVDAEAGYVVDESVVDEATFNTAKANGLYVLADDAIAALANKVAQNAADIADNDDAIDAVSFVQCTTNTVYDANTTYYSVDADGNYVQDATVVDADTFAAAVAAGTVFVKTTDAVKANEARIATIESALTWGTFA